MDSSRRTTPGAVTTAALCLLLLLAAATPTLAAQTQDKVPPYVEQHFKFLRSFLHPSVPDPHMDVWAESAHACQVEGAEGCADVTLYFLQELAKKPNSRHRELPRSKDAWVKYFKAIFDTCPAKIKPDAKAPGGGYDKCRADAARALVASGSGNAVLKLNTPIAVSWAVFFDLPACVLAQNPGQCNGIPCDKLIGWTATHCYDP